MTETALESLVRPGGITAVYQPIMRLEDGSSPTVYGVECLSRGPKGSNFEPAKVLFDYVRLKREESAIDRACVSAALANVPQMPAGLALSINVHASTLGRDRGFLAFLTEAAHSVNLDLKRLTVEIVEHAPPWDGAAFLMALDHLRGLGVKIALDDVGLGESNFKMILDACPDFLKLDRYFVDGCESDARRRAVISAIAQLASHFEGEVIAEGVSSPAVVDVLRSYGIRYFQGYLYSRPLACPELIQFLRAAEEPPARSKGPDLSPSSGLRPPSP